MADDTTVVHIAFKTPGNPHVVWYRMAKDAAEKLAGDFAGFAQHGMSGKRGGSYPAVNKDGHAVTLALNFADVLFIG